ncbi:hypothetical protein [Microbacterium sp. 22242]|uniref:hypothetical protein n=1 Tax=Microbacterium sp. 22242 TaxID=3453896 RepID=UPI003F826A76
MDPLQEILQWLGHYWWLVFFLPGLGYAGRYGLSGRRRRRRLESRQEEAPAAGYYSAPRAMAPPVMTPPVPPRADPAAQAAARKEQLQRLFAEHDEITARWLDYELDVAKVIAFPAMSDGRQPLTAAFLRAKKSADAQRPGSADAQLTEQHLTEYRESVANYAVAFEVAERDARRLRDSSFAPDERRRLERAQHMLKLAVDESATAAERQSAYRRVREELNGLIGLSDAAVENLEKKVALQLEPSATSSPEPATPTAPDGAPAPAPQPRPEPLPRPER